MRTSETTMHPGDEIWLDAPVITVIASAIVAIEWTIFTRACTRSTHAW